ncbi:guanosine-5'-triphosphate,3'-diphosphate pyrophosphatase [Colwelliaceae bacterium 6471]
MSSKHTEQPLYAVIDLGSNSFHMLITKVVANSVQTVDKIKRKVRLASGLDENNQLDDATIARGLECLRFFAERLQDIPASNIRIVATATLRIANNAPAFLAQAAKILGQEVILLSGQEEAEQIYLGVAHTSCTNGKRLVLDIGGASTEIIVGDGFKPKKVISLNMGCVTFKQKYFRDNQLTSANFDQAINAAKSLISPLVNTYTSIGWNSVLGGSGTMQALAEILSFNNSPVEINLAFMRNVQQQLIQCKTIEAIDIPGLEPERTPVIASGLAILIALFESLSIEQLQIASGALREGLLYEMLPNMRNIPIRERTIGALTIKFNIDHQHAQRVIQQAMFIYQHVEKNWQLSQDNSFELLKASCALHEVGVSLAFKNHQQHSAYIVEHADLPGFNFAEKHFIATLIKQYTGQIRFDELQQQNVTCIQTISYYLVILRLAIILCRRRRDDVIPEYQINATKNQLSLCLSKLWLNNHPLIADELDQERKFLQIIGIDLKLHC